MVKAEKAAKLAAVETQRAAKGGSDAAKKAKAKAPALPKEDLNTKELVAGPPEKVSRSAEGPADRTACNCSHSHSWLPASTLAIVILQARVCRGSDAQSTEEVLSLQPSPACLRAPPPSRLL